VFNIERQETRGLADPRMSRNVTTLITSKDDCHERQYHSSGIIRSEDLLY